MSESTVRTLPASVIVVVTLNVLTAIVEFGFFMLAMPGTVILGLVFFASLQLALSAGVVGLWVGIALLAILRVVAALGVLYRAARARRLLIGVAATDALGHVVLGVAVGAVDASWAAAVSAPALLDAVTIALLFTGSVRRAMH